MNPALPPAVDDGDRVAAAKDPAQRPPNLVTAVRALEAACERGGISVPRPTAGWDATTPAPGGLARQPTPAPPQSGTAPTMPAQLAMTPHALAETVASGAQSVVGPAPKSPLPWIVGGIGALIAGGVVFFLLRGGHRDAPPPPPRTAGDCPACRRAAATWS